MRPFLTLLLAAATLLPVTALAADVPVTYTVDSAALKLAISGTNLTLNLYSDAACTALTHTQVLTVDNVSLLSALKRSTPKGGVKPPKTTDIRATLTGVGATAPIYLTVTGTGVTPIGGACQVQASTTAGISGASLVVRDANGLLLGSLDVSGNIVMSDGGVPFLGYAPPSGFNQYSTFYYASTNCSGPRLLQPFLFAGGYIPYLNGVDGNLAYYGPGTAPLTAIASYDSAPVLPAACVSPGQVFNAPDRCCCTSPVCSTAGFANAGVPATMDISVFVPPFVAVLE